MTKANHGVREMGQRTDDSRLPTGIAGFDTLTRGGLPAGRTLVGLGWLVLAVAPLLVSISYARLQQMQRAESGWQRETADRAASFASDRGL